MTHVSCCLLRQTQRDHLVARPDRAIDQHTIGLLHCIEHMWLDLAQTRRLEQGLASLEIFDQQAVVVTGLGIGTMR